MDYSIISWFSLYLGVCLLGLFAWESANWLGEKSERFLLALCVGMVIATVLVGIAVPIRFQNRFFDLGRAPFFILFSVAVLLSWNLALRSCSSGKASLRENLAAAFLIIVLIWSMAFLFPFEFLKVTMYGQMVSFFVLVIPSVLIWEGVLDSDLKQRGVFEMVAVTALTFLALFLAVALGSYAWIS